MIDAYLSDGWQIEIEQMTAEDEAYGHGSVYGQKLWMICDRDIHGIAQRGSTWQSLEAALLNTQKPYRANSIFVTAAMYTELEYQFTFGNKRRPLLTTDGLVDWE